jgi:hypothetical protein
LVAASAVVVAGCSAAPPPPAPPSAGPPPAKLVIDAPAGADVHVDEVFVGVTPLPAPVDAEPGSHRVAVTLNGHEPFSKSVDLERGKTRALAVDLDETAQRKAAWGLIGGGGAVLSAGIVLGVLSVVEHRKSRDLLDEADGEDLGDEDQVAYDDAISARDRYRIGSGVAAGTALGLFVVGGFLFAFDAPPGPKPIAIVPALSPGHAGAAATIRF